MLRQAARKSEGFSFRTEETPLWSWKELEWLSLRSPAHTLEERVLDDTSAARGPWSPGWNMQVWLIRVILQVTIVPHV